MDRDRDVFMREALVEARRASEAGEIPIGAVVVLGGEVVGRGYNQPIGRSDPTAHAEIVALRDAAGRLHNYRLTAADLYVTVEPCLMCVGALVHARVETVIFGTVEPKSGALVSTVEAVALPGLNHRFTIEGGILEEECRALMQEFFQERRVRA